MMQAVLEFWFGTATDADAIARAQSGLWWGKNAATDATIRERFGSLHAQVRGGGHSEWGRTATGRLALILVIDQFSRNMYRDDPRAFADDPMARRWCVEGLASGQDRELPPIQRVFFYLPLEHSEALEDQLRCVALMEALAAAAPAGERELFDGYVGFARAHARIIERFGRFPHRNAILGRTSTPEETAFLREPNSAF